MSGMCVGLGVCIVCMTVCMMLCMSGLCVSGMRVGLCVCMLCVLASIKVWYVC